MQITRRSFVGSMLATGAAAATTGCLSCCPQKGKVAVQLYSIRDYINPSKGGVGLAKALADVAKIGYKGVEFAGYYGFKAEELKKMLDDNGLVGCGTHVGRNVFDPENMAKTCEFNLGFGNNVIICPGGGNRAPKDWTKSQDDWWKFLVDYYNDAADRAAKYGCKIGIHNHTWEFDIKLADGKTTMWDYFFSNTKKEVLMEQDVGWTTCAGYDPAEQYKKYPGRSITLHATENGMGKGVKEFDAILGQPGKPGAVPVDWDKLAPVADADGVKWWVVECERHSKTLYAITESFKFLQSKGRC